MKGRLWLISLLLMLPLLGGLSCTRLPEDEEDRGSGSGVVEGEKLRLSFSVIGPEETATRALDDGGVLHSLRLAVFGGSGYLKEYVEATAVAAGTHTYLTEDAHGDPVERTVPRYDYTVDLSMSESPRTVHFLGNGPAVLPFGYDTAVLPIQLSSNGEMGYWQMISLPDGIRAKRNAEGDFIDIDGNVIPDGGTGYIADAATELAFQEIPLIRNWSKIVLSADAESNFTPYSFAVVNVPSRGTMVPYSAGTGFLQHYQDLSFTYLEDEIAYPANLPAGTTFDTTIPETAAFSAPLGAGVAPAEGGAVYLYERPAPSANIPPSCVILYGHYRNPSDLEHEGDYFYKVDLMETKRSGEEFISRYYPIFRNFKYQIIVKKILSQGHATPAAAAASAGSADVSADVSTQALADISDGIGRLHVQPWMSKAFTREHGAGNPVQDLSVWFGTTDGEPYLEDGRVTVRLLDPEDGGDDILYNISIDAAVQSGEQKGWRNIKFYNVAPGKTVRTQKIRITGLHDDGRLYRDIPITLQPIQPMAVHCGEDRIPALKGTEQTVIIEIPDGLVESMFPLDFTIEAEKMTLTPDNEVADNNLPVVSNPSISDDPRYREKPAFQFVRTLTWRDYLSLERVEDEEERMWRSFTCYFRTNRDESATDIYVYNEFFDKASTHFDHFFYKQFNNLNFTTPIPQAEDVTVPVTWTMVEDSDGVYPADYPYVLIEPSGLWLELGGNVTAGPDPGTYYVKPTGHTVTVNFVTTTSDPDEIEVILKAEGYDTAVLVPSRFPFASLLDGHPTSTSGGGWGSGASTWSNVAWGYVNNADGKSVIFGFKDAPTQPNPPVTLTLTSGLKSPSVSFPATLGPRNAKGEALYHEIEMKTVGGNQDVVFSLSAPGYITETFRHGRFNGNIRTMKITNNNAFKKNNTYGFTMEHPYFDYTEDNGSVRVSFDQISEETNGKVILHAGGTYQLTINSRNANQTLFYVNFWFTDSNGTVYAPESMTPDVGTIERYPGSNNQYLWHIPRGNLRGIVTIQAPDNLDVWLYTMYVKSMNGDLYENGIKL